MEARAGDAVARSSPEAGRTDIPHPRDTGRPLLRALASPAGTAGIALLLPFVLLLVGLPVVLVATGITAAVGRLLAWMVA